MSGGCLAVLSGCAWWLCAGWVESQSCCCCSGLTACSSVEFAQYRGDVVIDGLLGHHEVLCDLRVAPALAQQR